MKRAIGALLCCVLALTSLATIAGPVAAGPYVLVVSKKLNVLQVFDLGTQKLIEEIDTGDGPHEVVASRDGRFAYVSDFDSRDNTISVIDIAKRARMKTINVHPEWGPHGLALTGDGSRLYATTEKTRSLVEIDPSTGKRLRTFKTNMRVGHMCVLSPDDKFLFVSNSGSNNITVIDLAAGEVERHIYSGKGCEGIDVTPDGKELWVSNRAGETVSIINLETRKREDTVPCRGFPIRVKASPKGDHVFVTCPTMGTVVVFDRAERKIIREIRTGTFPIGLLVEPNGKRLFVANTRDNKVAIVDLTTFEVTGELITADEPDGMAYVK